MINSNKDLLKKLINKIGSSYFDDNLIDEITNCTILATNSSINYNNDAIILLKDIINSFLSMSKSPRSLVVTQPMKIVQFSSWFAFLKKYKIKSNYIKEFKDSILCIVNSDFFINMEWPEEVMFNTYVNVYGLDEVSKRFPKLYEYCNKDLDYLLSKIMFVDINTIKESINFYGSLYKTHDNFKYPIIYYSLFSNDLKFKLYCSSLFSKKCIYNVNYDERLTISELYGIILFEFNENLGESNGF